MLGNWSAIETERNGDGVYDSGGDEQEIRAHNAANQIDELTPSEAAAGGTPPTLPFLYDKAGNLSQKGISDGNSRRGHVYDAWNRLVEVRAVPAAVGAGDPSSGTMILQRSRYNALHWRVVADAARDDAMHVPAYAAPDEPNLRRVMSYDASWRLIHEDVYESPVDVAGDPPVATPEAMPAATTPCDSGWLDRQCQTIYGVRGLDDIILRRVFDGGIVASEGEARGGGGHFYLTDPQGSPLAIVDATGRVAERLEYDAFGGVRHNDFGSADEFELQAARQAPIAHPLKPASDASLRRTVTGFQDRRIRPLCHPTGDDRKRRWRAGIGRFPRETRGVLARSFASVWRARESTGFKRVHPSLPRSAKGRSWRVENAWPCCIPWRGGGTPAVGSRQLGESVGHPSDRVARGQALGDR